MGPNNLLNESARLMRVPDTIHGGTGLLAARVKDLDEFDPATDAVAFGKAEASVMATKKIPKFSIGETTVGPIKEGEKVTLPEYAAIYLILKQAAEAG